MFFTNLGRAFAKRVFDVPEMSRTSQGRSAANLLNFQKDEKIASVLAIKDFEKGEQFLMFCTARGIVKKTALSAFGNIRTNGLIAIGLDEGDFLIGVAVTGGGDHLLLATKSGLAVRFEESHVRSMGRTAGGLIGVRFKREGDGVVAMVVIPDGDNTKGQILTGCVNGYGKRTPLEDYPTKGRGTQGVINIDANDRNGEVVGVKLVNANSSLMMITEKGILIRTRVDQIRETGRNASGVRLVRLDEGDKLVALAGFEEEEPTDTGTSDGEPSDTPPDVGPAGDAGATGSAAPPEAP